MIAAFAISSGTWFAGTFATLDNAYVDLQTRWLQEEIPSEIVIVEIDARSLKELGIWPLPRSRHAELLDNLSEAGVARVFLDIDFSAPSTADEDARLESAIASARPTILLPAFWQPISQQSTGLVLSEPLPAFAAHAQLGLVNLVPGKDGLVREIPDFSDLSAELSPVWAQVSNEASRTTGALRLDYRIAPSSFRRFSYVDAVRGTIDVPLGGVTVFVGATALELGDIVAVPVHRALPGVIVQAIAAESAQSLRSLADATPTQVLMALAPWILLCGWLLRRVNWRRTPLTALALILSALAICSSLYSLADTTVPISPFVVAAIIVLTGSLLASLNIESLRAWRALLHTRDQDALLREVVENSSDAILTLDARGHVRTANPTALSILGKTERELIGFALASLAPTLVDALQRAAARHETRLHRADGSCVVLEVTTAHLDWDDERITTVTMHDVTVQRTREAELRHLAQHDTLTGLPNRAFLAERLAAALNSGTTDGTIAGGTIAGGTIAGGAIAGGTIALLMLDLDGFKEVNDTLGHSMGDALLIELSARLSQFVNEHRFVARVGGDEFAVLWNAQRPEELEELAQQLLLVVEEPILIKGIPVSLGTSIGIARYPEHAKDPESLLQRADVALYVAKRKASRVEFYDPSEDTHSPRRLEMLTQLRAAVSRGELHLHYQPKVMMSSGATTEVEALCRWENPVLGSISPVEFITLAEASDVIKPLTEWTIRQALLDCRDWRHLGIDLKVAVNLSARHLQDARLPQWLDALFSSTSSQPSWLELEITESAIMADPDRASKILHALREMGLVISIDDFGTGYSSLAYLRTLAVNRLKIDRSFIMGIEESHTEQIIVESTIKLAHGLGLLAVAEGIETESQYAILRELGCDIGQGFAIGRPMPKAELLSWHRRQRGQLWADRNWPLLRQSVG
jgi:diguanylate cyclase (GGDEF)-like protein/PAS domain S-box-containing protein